MLLAAVGVLVIVLVAGAAYLLDRGGAGEARAWRAAAVTGCVAGILAIVLTGLVAVISFTPLLDAAPFRGPLALLGFAGLPVALVGMVTSTVGLKAPSHGLAIVGLTLSVLSVVGWIVMQNTAA